MARIRVSNRADALEKIIEARIRQGEYPREHRLPTERELAEELNYSRGTIRKAYQSLHHKGLIYYQKRSFWVSSDLAELELRFQKNDRKNIALFFHPEDYDPHLLSALEKHLRKKKYHPLSFNLQSMDREDGSFDFMGYLHTNVVGAIFISALYGPKCALIDQKMMLSLPLPYIFLAKEPFFDSPRYLGLQYDDLVKKIIQQMKEWKTKKVSMVFPWPLKLKQSLVFSYFTQACGAEGLVLKADDCEVLFVDSKKKSRLKIKNEPGHLTLWFTKMPDLESMAGESKHLYLEGTPFLNVASYCLEFEQWSKLGVDWIEKNIELSEKGQIVPPCAPVLPRLILKKGK